MPSSLSEAVIVMDTNKSLEGTRLRKILLAALIIATVVLAVYMFVALFSPESIGAINNGRFTNCLESLSAMRIGEQAYFKENKSYTDDPDLLAYYIVPGCKKQDGSDCKGKIVAGMDKYCKPGTVRIELDPKSGFFRIKALAADRYHCPICITPNGARPLSYRECGPQYTMSCL